MRLAEPHDRLELRRDLDDLTAGRARADRDRCAAHRIRVDQHHGDHACRSMGNGEHDRSVAGRDASDPTGEAAACPMTGQDRSSYCGR
jgi:hypothetical protein